MQINSRKISCLIPSKYIKNDVKPYCQFKKIHEKINADRSQVKLRITPQSIFRSHYVCK